MQSICIKCIFMHLIPFMEMRQGDIFLDLFPLPWGKEIILVILRGQTSGHCWKNNTSVSESMAVSLEWHVCAVVPNMRIPSTFCIRDTPL